ncbi:transglutaminase domain-containing protein [Vagococcus sp. BWB3-3]|uniref:Transglutaminase domain-containing protein n=1 Tax=Vagococcus allomyrinae TaxID=2794353 RepID=A0A940PI64_9ENTE|nr:transglutaminase-like domain-containing protein [Vagococcus allomyrinae]MBP1043358.1 transglutaminase domain-containing protein [Vagococcus allomyrinae]
MKGNYLNETKLLNYNSPDIQALVTEKKWQKLADYQKIKEIYEFVQNDILFGYNASDKLTANRVLAEGVGQCNTKATLLMALLRAVGIPCRLHAFEVSKGFQRGATTGVISWLAPDFILHTWVEVYYQKHWYALEGVITDKKYLQSVQKLFSYERGAFNQYAIATKDLQNPPIDWNGNDTYIQKEAISRDFGLFDSPDDLLMTHQQKMSGLKNFFYTQVGCKIMTRTVNKVRNNRV